MKKVTNCFLALSLVISVALNSVDIAFAGTPLPAPTAQTSQRPVVRKIRFSQMISIYNSRRPENTPEFQPPRQDAWIYIFSRPLKAGTGTETPIDFSEAELLTDEIEAYNLAFNGGNYLIRLTDRGENEAKAAYSGIGKSLLSRNLTELSQLENNQYYTNAALQASFAATVDRGSEPEFFWLTSSYYNPEYQDLQTLRTYEELSIKNVTKGKFKIFDIREVPLNNKKNPQANNPELAEAFLRSLTKADGTPLLSNDFWATKESIRQQNRERSRRNSSWTSTRKRLRQQAQASFKAEIKQSADTLRRAYAQAEANLNARYTSNELTEEQFNREKATLLENKVEGLRQFQMLRLQAQTRFNTNLSIFLGEQRREFQNPEGERDRAYFNRNLENFLAEERPQFPGLGPSQNGD